MKRITWCVIALCWCGARAQEVDITPAKPTHYFYTPTCSVNPVNHFVASFHEISYGLGGGLQAQLSLIDNIGRINFGLKYLFADRFAGGAGLAHSFHHIGRHSPRLGVENRSRLGLFLCYGLVAREDLESALTAHAQIGNSFSMGVDFGLMSPRSELWSLIAEIGSLLDLDHGNPFLNFAGGIRIHPPRVPYLNFDFGLDLHVLSDYDDPFVSPFLDVLFGMVF